MSASLSGVMLSIGVTRPERTASLTSGRGMSAHRGEPEAQPVGPRRALSKPGCELSATTNEPPRSAA